MKRNERQLGWIRGSVAAIGATFIYFLIRLFGRVVRVSEHGWLAGPVGGDYIGDSPYEDCAKRENLTVTRDAKTGGLVPDFKALSSATFDVAGLHPAVRHFYEHTAAYRLDVWAATSFPANLALWLLVTTISRKVNQLNFPLRTLETAKGMKSEIVLLRESNARIRYTGWYRQLAESGNVIYAGFYMTETAPLADCPCVKVVFPMPQGNATVVLRPKVEPSGALELSSDGRGFGDAGFYRMQELTNGRLRVWYVSHLKEKFRVYVDDSGTLRCDHTVRFLGFPVLHLHYRMEVARTKQPVHSVKSVPAPG